MGSKTFQTMCPMNCHPTLCGMKVQVTDGKLQSITGDKDNPDSQGVLCMRGNASHEIVGNSARLLHPMIRENPASDDWRKIEWDDCLDFIAEKMQAVGRESVGFWQGHGNAANDYGFGLKRWQMERFANLYGCQYWNPAMICWGLGGLGFGLTGAIETSTKEDMSAHSDLMILWGANAVSQANTMKHVEAAKRRGAYLIVIDVRKTEAGILADELYLVNPGSDADLALSMMNLLIEEDMIDASFIREHTSGFTELKQHVKTLTPEWAAGRTGLTVDRIVSLTKRYANAEAAMIIVGGSSIHKGANTWQAARAIACLPGLTGKFGKPGGGIGPRHGARSHAAGFADISASERRLPGNYVPNQMQSIVEALEDGTVKVLFTIGSNFLSSFPETVRVREALLNAELVVAYDLFSNQTIRETANILLPGTLWLEEIGCKSTNTHVYLCDRALPIEGKARPVYEIYKGLAERLKVDDVYPWESQEQAINEVLHHPATGFTNIDKMKAHGGRCELKISHTAYPTFEFHTPSGKLEFHSDRAEQMGLPPLPMPACEDDSDDNSDDEWSRSSLILTHGRTFAHFHAFYDHARALPTLAAREKHPQLWIAPGDAEKRGVSNNSTILISNQRGEFNAQAKVTDRIKPGVVWMRDGWPGFNSLTSYSSVVPDSALSEFPFSVGQSYFGCRVAIECCSSVEN